MADIVDARFRPHSESGVVSARVPAAPRRALSVKRLISALALLAAIMMSVSTPALAHKKPRQQVEQVQAGQQQPASTPSMQGMGGMMSTEKDRASMSTFERLTDWLGRLHPMVIHFPIAFIIGALFTAVAGRRRPAFAKPVQFLVVAAGITAPIAAALGWVNGGFSMTDTDPLLGFHRWVGTGVGIGAFALAVWAWRRPDQDRGTAMIVSLTILTVAVVIQGWLGGAMVHGIDHLNW